MENTELKNKISEIKIHQLGLSGESRWEERVSKPEDWAIE